MIRSPIMLIHGFNGAPSNWTGPEDRFPEYLVAHDFDPELIRIFSYGYDTYNGKRTYNNLGDMREIAHRLDDPDGQDAEHCSVDRLSRESVARGGSPQVTIIAHSSGGLVARYYLTRQVEDEYHTRYRGNVGRVIFLGTPHRGVDIEDVLDPLPTNLLVYRLMIRLHYLLPPEYHGQSESLRAKFHDLGQQTRQAFYGDGLADAMTERTPAFNQLHPGSDFLNDINRPGAMPQGSRYFNIIGDICAGVRIHAFGRDLLNRDKDFGDFLVSASSAGSIPNAESECCAIRDRAYLTVDLGRRSSRLVQLDAIPEQPVPIHRHLRSLPAARERMLEILRRDPDHASGGNPAMTAPVLPKGVS